MLQISTHESVIFSPIENYVGQSLKTKTWLPYVMESENTGAAFQGE